jgi:hypothetical protein
MSGPISKSWLVALQLLLSLAFFKLASSITGMTVHCPFLAWKEWPHHQSRPAGLIRAKIETDLRFTNVDPTNVDICLFSF